MEKLQPLNKQADSDEENNQRTGNNRFEIESDFTDTQPNGANNEK